jgi:hypothetical protein
MWCHLLGLSSTAWIPIWILAVKWDASCAISPLSILLNLQTESDSPTWTLPFNSCTWVIPLLMLLLAPCITLANWLHQRTLHPFIDAQGKESVNFQFSIAIVIGFMLVFFNLYLFQTSQAKASPGIPALPFWLGLLAAFAFFPLINIFQVMVTLFAAAKAVQGETYRYPGTWRWLK